MSSSLFRIAATRWTSSPTTRSLISARRSLFGGSSSLLKPSTQLVLKESMKYRTFAVQNIHQIFVSPSRIVKRSYFVLPSSWQQLTTHTIESIKYYLFGKTSKDTTSSKRLFLLTSEWAVQKYHNANAKLVAAWSLKKKRSISRKQSRLRMVRDNYKLYNRRARRAIKDRYARTASSVLASMPTLSPTNVIISRRAKKLFHKLIKEGYQSASTIRELKKVSWNSPGFMKRLKVVELTDTNDYCKFDAQGFPLVSYAPEASAKRFISPWSASACEHEPLSKFAKWQYHRHFGCPDRFPKNLADFYARTEPYMSVIPTTTNVESGLPSIHFTWIGHSTCLAQMHGFSILTDPVFSQVIGPMAPLFGDKRYVPPSHNADDLPLQPENLGVIDVVCISHDHYDHLDYSSIYQLVQSDTVAVRKWCVPLGTKKWFLDNFGKEDEARKYIEEDDVIEMSWWEEFIIHKGSDKQLKVTCAPSQHWCARTPFDRNARLWASWAFQSTTDSQERLAFYFGGDTGIPDNGFPLFSQIGNRLGPFDLSALPVGAYKPDNFIGDSHIGPAEASQIAHQLHTKQSVAIHWGTFPMGDEPFYEPAKLLRSLAKNNDFLLLRQGQSIVNTPDDVVREKVVNPKPLNTLLIEYENVKAA